MAITSARLARVRATLLGATVRRLQARHQREAQSTLQAMITEHVARQAVRLQANMEAWKQRCAATEARTRMQAVLTSAKVRRAVRTALSGQGSQARDTATGGCGAAKAAWGLYYTSHKGKRCEKVQGAGTSGQPTGICATEHTDTLGSYAS